MSRPSSMMATNSAMAQRNLSLTEELEKLEQSITLTLQEIDHNFSRAHRIVTGSIIPVVDQYAKHSEAVWEGSKFWKQFFEASANVSLSGYEEPTAEDTTMQPEDTTHVSAAYDDSPSIRNDTTLHSAADCTSRFEEDDEGLEDSLLSSPSMAKTPRNRPTSSFTDNYSSPYEALKRELQGEKTEAGASKVRDDASSDASGLPEEGTVIGAPTTPGKVSHSTLPDMSMTPESSPFAPGSADQHTRHTRQASNNDPLLHRMLDKTYRIAATPHTVQKTRPGASTTAATPGTNNHTRRRLAFDSSPMSSPEAPAPQLRADLFSPAKTPRTPGVSVYQQHQTPGKSGGAGAASKFTGGARDFITWDSDSEGDTEFSPPKTMHFHVPQSRLMQTPAREASKKIVEDLLLTAGGGELTDSNVTADSPSIVRRNVELDDSF
ncbi:DASH complex subunit Ask1-domain-containing protein [Macrophomina phaseolina]|uniref:DASH complex subunit ASK1 n=1 Tax=Macrophomina phaseolina TaxID=35725 RepID=A0ABQ8GCM6_9PEZI|nr:DASH complex subunit Ask1-domain-containing protein [Macrophomina phaseolina]